MERRPQHSPTKQQVEAYAATPTALIATTEGFITSYLSQQLLELPIHVMVVSPTPREELKHLRHNPRFSEKTEAELLNEIEYQSTSIDYVFRVTAAEEPETDERLRFDKTLLEYIHRRHTKYQLAVVTNDLHQFLTRQPLSLESETRNPEGFPAGKAGLPAGEAGSDQGSLIGLARAAQASGADVRMISLLHVYGPKMPMESDWQMPTLLRSLQRERRLPVSGDGLIPLYPVFAADAATAMTKAMFAVHWGNHQLLIGGSQEITVLNLAYQLREMLLRRVGESTQIVFVDGATTTATIANRASLRQLLAESRDILGWEPTLNLEEGIDRTLDWLHLQPTPSTAPAHFRRPAPIVASLSQTAAAAGRPATSRRRSLRLQFLRVAASFALAGLSFILVYLVSLGAGTFWLSQAVKSLREARLDDATRRLVWSDRAFRVTAAQLKVVDFIPLNIFTGSQETAKEYLEFARLLTSASERSIVASRQGIELRNAILQGSQEATRRQVSRLGDELDGLHTILSRIEVTMLGVDEGPPFSGWVAANLQDFLQSITRMRTTITDLRTMLELLPELIGVNGRRTYLVLLQNNAELRPTGGFIGSYALLTFESGRLVEWEVEDVYVADGQLKGHVEPPREIKEYLGEAGWYLRDSNWDPDFPTTARQVEWFFAKEKGRRVDGTIAVNLIVVADLLEALGPIEIPDYGKQVTSANLFTAAQFQAEMKFFPGSTQKGDFLTSLARQLFFAIEGADAEELLRTAASLMQSLRQGQILVALHHPNLAARFAESGWDGSLRGAPCPPEAAVCFTEYYALREANLGVNKVNYFVKREIEAIITFPSENPTTSVGVNLENTSPDANWPGGTYKNYLRLYTSLENILERVTVDGYEVANHEITTATEHGKQVVGLLVNIPPRSKRHVRFDFKREWVQDTGSPVTLGLMIQKQPGTTGDPLTVRLAIPQGTTVTNTSYPLTVTEEGAVLKTAMSEDLLLLIEFASSR